MCGDRSDGSDNKTSPLWSRNGPRGRANNKSYAIHHRPPGAAQRCGARAPCRGKGLNESQKIPPIHGAALGARCSGWGRRVAVYVGRKILSAPSSH